MTLSSVNIPRPTLDTEPFKSLVVNSLEPLTGLQCGKCEAPIVACGFDCAFSGYVHSEGSRRGSHKCGMMDGYITSCDASISP